MARICIVTPARAGTRNGNRHTAQRWAGFLRALGHRVSVAVQWDGEPIDLLLALHARRSHDSVVAFRKQFPDEPLVVTLTGTDLYRDLPASREARESLRLADRVIVLQDDALRILDSSTRKKARVAYQSATPSVRHAPPKDRFRVSVVGHLREEKDPFRTALALPFLEQDLEVVQVGDALSPRMAAEARRHMKRDRRYRWLGGLSHARSLGWIARSHLLVVSSVMEGGANVIAEAARIGTPVLASRVSGNLGMLGRGYPGYFPLFNERALAMLIERNIQERTAYQELKRALAARRPLFAPAAERQSLRDVLQDHMNSADPVVTEYARAAKDYDEKWSFYVEATTRETLKRLPMAGVGRVLDVGCGTGELLSRIAGMYPEVVLAGIDPVPEMLAVARNKLPEQCEFRVGYANALPWPDGSFDVVVSCNMFHYVTHPVPAIREMTRVLKTGGKLVITDWCDDYLACRICNIYLRITNRAYYKTYRQQECLGLLAEAGHPAVQIERYKINWLWGLMTAVVVKP